LAYSYSAHNDGGRIPDPQVCDWSNEKQMTQDIASLDSKVDFLIVSTHMGTEYKRDPDPRNVELAHKAIDSGADMLIGHHPHWIQTIEEYNGKWIFYSLGNFVFDQMWSQDTKEGLTIFATFEDKTLKNIELRPVLIDDYCCPRWALSAEAQLILAKINLTSPYLMNKN
ncbi:MAG TPA: CapA family protein, partial [Verrucomicrobiae bacterium]|nr:CapA family protein [Verrucomicrobiae bacterium]